MTLSEEQFMEALGILQEECAEVIKEVSKVRRSGKDFRPHGGEKTNLDNLNAEVQDVLSLLRISGMDQLSDEFFMAKCEKLRQWSTLFDSKEPTPAAEPPVVTPEINDETAILRRLAGGDRIHFSQDGEMAYFAQGDGALVGSAITKLRKKGYLLRRSDDEENYRGGAEYDTINAKGLAVLKEHAERPDFPTGGKPPRLCPQCRDARWVDDENWDPVCFDITRSRIPRDGLIPCRACNFDGDAEYDAGRAALKEQGHG